MEIQHYKTDKLAKFAMVYVKKCMNPSRKHLKACKSYFLHILIKIKVESCYINTT